MLISNGDRLVLGYSRLFPFASAFDLSHESDVLSNTSYELANKTGGTACGGLAAMHAFAKKIKLPQKNQTAAKKSNCRSVSTVRCICSKNIFPITNPIMSRTSHTPHYMLFFDGHVDSISDSIDLEHYRALSTPDGGCIRPIRIGITAVAGQIDQRCRVRHWAGRVAKSCHRCLLFAAIRSVCQRRLRASCKCIGPKRRRPSVRRCQLRRTSPLSSFDRFEDLNRRLQLPAECRMR